MDYDFRLHTYRLIPRVDYYNGDVEYCSDSSIICTSSFSVWQEVTCQLLDQYSDGYGYLPQLWFSCLTLMHH